MLSTRQVLPRFKEASPGARFFLSVRWRLTPYLEMAAELPKEGRILDLGCGHGLLALAIALTSEKRSVHGIDHDEERVKLANAAATEVKNLSFSQGGILELPSDAGDLAGITMIDVMHYFEPALQAQLVQNAWNALAPGGVLVVREVDPAGGPASAFNRLYEKVATGIGFTQADKVGHHFKKPEEWKSFLEGFGFEVSSRPCSHFLFADILFVCRKPKA